MIVKERQLYGYIFFTGLVCYILGYLADLFPGSSTVTQSYDATSSSSYSSIDYDRAKETLDISVYNEYTKDKPLQGDYPWEYIVEPYRKTTLCVTNAIDGYHYSWYVNDWHQEDASNITMLFLSPTGEYSAVKVYMIDSTTNEVQTTAEINVMIKYVRREIRSLIDQDRLAFFNAVSIMQRVPTSVGKKIYGDRYRSRDYFNRIHLYYGGNITCDHWHQGPGFVTSHITFSLLFEQSLQSINPSISLPYWDFTLESTLYTPETFRYSGVFSSDWFGDSVCSNDYHTPSEGRFAYVPVMEDASKFSLLVNSYGLLRSPWNADPTPYLTRSNNIYNWENNLKPSGCSEYYNSLIMKDWKNLAIKLNSAAHGHIHELIGGSWNPYYNISTPANMSDDGIEGAYEFAHGTEAYSKLLWRYGYLVCPEECSADTDTFDCQCTCVNPSNYTIPHILTQTGIIKSLIFFDKNGTVIDNWQNKTSRQAYDQLPGYTLSETQEMYNQIFNVLCNPGYMGDMFQATSTNDITFWILHPTLERLWHLSRLNYKNGLIDFDEEWPDSSQSCAGHYSYDHTPFKNIFDSNNVVYTNEELYDLLDPTTDEFPYIFEHFRWTHCTLLGYDMTGL